MKKGYRISFIEPSYGHRESVVFFNLSIALNVLEHFTKEGFYPHLTIYGGE